MADVVEGPNVVVAPEHAQWCRHVFIYMSGFFFTALITVSKFMMDLRFYYPPVKLAPLRLSWGYWPSSLDAGLASTPWVVSWRRDATFKDGRQLPSSPNSTNFHEYTLSDGVYSIVPSGFMAHVNYLKSCGYPQPPPLMLEINGRLLNTFEEDFGQLYGYEDCDCNFYHCDSEEQVWAKLKKKVVTNICRRVVSLSSYDGDVRFFSCTGLLIKWHTNGTPVILTSASLVRSRVDEDKIDEKLKIKVLLTPKQVVDGTLELYHSDYNIAIISLQKPLYGIRPEYIFSMAKRPPRVVAIGREAQDGLLMGTIGKAVKKFADEKLPCEDLKLSICKIKKVGIGGPLVNIDNGLFAGMNFYGETDVTPYVPRAIIVDVLSGIDLPSQRMDHATDIMGDATVKKNRWPVPKTYWYHPLFDDDAPLHFYGRQLQ